MDDRKPTRAKDDDVPIVGDYSAEQDARLGAGPRSARPPISAGAAASSTAARPPPPAAARPPPPAAPKASGRPANRGGPDAWVLDPRDVERHARLRRQTAKKGPLAKAARYGAVVLALAAAFGVYWNFDTLRQIRVDVPALAALLSSSVSTSGGGNNGSGSAEVASTVVAGAAAPTSVATAAPEPQRRIEPPNAAERSAPQPVARTAAPPPGDPQEPRAGAQEAPQAAEEPREASRTVAEPQETPPAAASAAAAESSSAAENVAAVPVVVERPEPPPTPEKFAFALPKVTVSERDAAAAVLIVRSGGRRGPSTVTWWTSDGTANAGSDYVDLGRVVVKFAAGEQNHTIRVPIIGDNAVEGPESFYVNLAAGDDPSAEAEERVEVVIEDDD